MTNCKSDYATPKLYVFLIELSLSWRATVVFLAAISLLAPKSFLTLANTCHRALNTYCSQPLSLLPTLIVLSLSHYCQHLLSSASLIIANTYCPQPLSLLPILTVLSLSHYCQHLLSSASVTVANKWKLSLEFGSSSSRTYSRRKWAKYLADYKYA